ncbi:hypothetical protein Adt_03889 [Abeliophyllum distichum]|uniref:Uncharacterized protein n=1 Tax=Abeliophyllum distichum TaxID=126358 RepID=A0ABD1VZS8_9LAMI
MPDDALRNVPFYPSMGAQAVKKYFTPKWKEFASHGGPRGCVGGWPGHWQSRASAMQLEGAWEGRRPKLSLPGYLAEKKEMEAKLENVEAEFVANFYNTEAYTNFSGYFTRVGHQEVLTVLRIDHPSIDLGPLEAGFPPPNVEGEDDG